MFLSFSSFYSLYRSRVVSNTDNELQKIENNFIIISYENNSDYCININSNQEDKEEDTIEEIECVICIQELNIKEDSDVVMLRKCNHLYHIMVFFVYHIFV